MLTLLTSAQTHEADAFTIKSQSISSNDLMEKASGAFVKAFIAEFTNRDVSVSAYCGTGNNGGDGLAIARLLKDQGYDNLNVKIARFSPNSTIDFEGNLQRLGLTGIPITEITSLEFPPEDADILIEALLGSGLNKPLKGEFKKLVEHLNALGKTIVSVDVPAGFPSEGLIDPQSTIIKAELVISFQRPKINFFFPESAPFIKRFRFVDIGLDENFIQSQRGGWKLTKAEDIQKIFKPRKPFSHKGTFGHALIIAGNAETMGAALLCADACLHSGAGLTTACIPPEGLTALNSRSPEVMALIRNTEEKELEIDFKKYQAIGVGPGLGKGDAQARLLKYVLEHAQAPLVLDADALNILSENQNWMNILPAKSIITPHVKEFDRLFGEHDNWWERVEACREQAAQHQLIIVLKNQYSFVILPDGDVLINPTGNPAMAVGGMGDVLTGMIVAFLAQGYRSEEAAILACYIHGETGDVLNKKSRMNCIPPRYLINELPKTINSFY